jgi:hypothetical protein
MAEVAKGKKEGKDMAWTAEFIPSSMALFTEESISPSFRSTWDCAEIAA